MEFQKIIASEASEKIQKFIEVQEINERVSPSFPWYSGQSKANFPWIRAYFPWVGFSEWW